MYVQQFSVTVVYMYIDSTTSLCGHLIKGKNMVT